MLGEERKNKILEIVNRKKAVQVTELSKKLDVTEATIRRDLEELQKEHKLRRTHGGAVALYTTGQGGSITNLSREHIAEKQKIAQMAYDYISNCDTILFDGSSTVYELANLLANGEKKDITILTNSVHVIRVLSEKAQKNELNVIHVGGEMRYHLGITMGDIAIQTIRKLRVDKTFIGVNGVDAAYGFSIANMSEAMVKREMIHSAVQTFVLADNSKFGKTYLAQITNQSGDIDYLITDSRIEDFDYDLLEEKTHLVFADDPQ